MQGHDSGLLDAIPLIAVAMSLHASGSSHLAWQNKDHRSSIQCLLEHSCDIFDDLEGMTLVHLLISGCSAGVVSACHVHSGESFFSLRLHTTEVSVLSGRDFIDLGQ